MQLNQMLMTVTPDFVEILPNQWINRSQIIAFSIVEQESKIFTMFIRMYGDVHPSIGLPVKSREEGLAKLGIVRQSPLSI